MLDKWEEAAERVSDDTEEMATVLTFMDAANILTSGGVQVVPTAAEVATATVCIPTGSGVVSTASPTIPTASEGSGTPIEPHHTPSFEAQQTSPTTRSSPSLLHVTTEPLPTVIPSDNPPLRQYTRRARIAQSSTLPPTDLLKNIALKRQ
nr:hypothetical protein [Tanacetum cinerariifolium]